MQAAVNFDANAIYHIASGGPETLVAALSMGLRPEYLDGPAAKAMAFAAQHHATTGTVPTTVDFEGLFGSACVAQTGIESSIVFSELMKRAMFRRVQAGVAAVEGKLKANDPYGAFAEWNVQGGGLEAVTPNHVEPTPLWSLGKDVKENYELIKSGAIGIESPWESLNAMTMGFWPRQNTWFVARPGVGKCVDSETLIMDPVSGAYRPIREVVESKGMVLKRDMGTGEVVPVMPDAHLSTGRKETFRVTLRSGRELVATPEHPLLTVDGWRRLDELAVGQHVESVSMVPEPTDAISPPDSEVIMMAALLAEGGYTSSQVSFTNDDPVIVEMVRSSAASLGAEMVHHNGARRFEYAFRWPGGGKGFHGVNPVRHLLDMYGCGSEKAVEKSIPNRVFRYSNEKLALFLGVFWSCDGSLPLKGGSRGACVGLGSKVMVEQIQRLLLRFGVTSRIRFKPVKLNDSVFDSWHSEVHASRLGRFAKSIAIVGEKESKLLDLSDSVNPNVDNIPMTDSLRALVNERWVVGSRWKDGTTAVVRAILGRTISASHITRRETISRRVFAAFVEATSSDDLRHLMVNHWDEIVSIEPAGVREVYDLTVMGDHCFVANDITVHNTWLQIICGDFAWKLRKRPDGEAKYHNVLIISPEMPKAAMAERFFTVEAEVGYGQVVGATLGHFAEDKFFKKVESMSEETGMWILDATDGLTPERIEDAIDAVEADLVVIDSVYKIKWKEKAKDRFENMYEGVDIISSWAKRTWKDGREIHIIAASQMNRGGDKKGGSKQTSVALADNLNWEADNLFFVEQTEDMKADKRLRLITGKCRRMAEYKKSLLLRWDMDTMDFGEVPEVAKPKPKFKDSGYAESPF